MTALGTAVTGLTLAAAFVAGLLAGLAIAAVTYAVAFRHRLEAAEDRARLAQAVGYRAGLVEGMAAEDRLTAQRDALIEKLKTANEAFDECTGGYAKELVADESWRVNGVAS